jgi:4-hydroxybenzoate polyprenyltransferase
MSTLIPLHRLENPFWLHYLCCAAWGACYAGCFDLRVALAIAATVLAIVAGNPLNAYADVRNDQATAGKRHIADAVLAFGPDRVLALAFAEMAAAVALATLVSARVAAGIAVIAVLYLAYNLEPVRLKRRGYAGPVVLSLAAGFVPSVVAYAAADVGFDRWVWLIFTGVGLLAVGRALWWAVPDRDGDAAVGSLTPVVRHGIRHALTAAAVSTAAGLALLGTGLWARHGPAWALLGVAACAVFLLARSLPSSRLMRRYGMTAVVGSYLVIGAIPLLD